VAIDDDLFVMTLTSKGIWSLIFFILMIAAMVWQCHQEKKCGPDEMYFKDNNVCVNKEALSRPGEKKK
jgi:hypothetical protein